MTEDVLPEILRRKKLADYYYDNYREHYEEKKLGKASEFIWGTINALVYAIGLFYNRKIGKHNQVVDFVEELSIIEANEDMMKQLASAERIHANFFHDFMNELTFEDDRKRTEELIETLSNILDAKIKELFKS